MSKSPEMSATLDKIYYQLNGMTRTEALEHRVCSSCFTPAEEFRDEISKKEYQISALCQACQDKVFTEDEDDLYQMDHLDDWDEDEGAPF